MCRLFERIMELYIFENYKEIFPEVIGSELTDRLILKSLEMYGAEAGEVLRTDKGKPYIADTDINISVSHSGSCFVCLIASQPAGVDIQQERRAGTDKISRRYFTEEECDYVTSEGAKGFYRLWTRKEAYSKYTGRGLEEIIKGTPVLHRDDVDFFDFQLEKGLYCSCCTKKQKK